ncbi:pyrroline-5-carboxylate reductase [Campylobacterota bacterium]|nr:pyrroline-5-carboxylate reductase [Campylobacterota bacterium]
MKLVLVGAGNMGEALLNAWENSHDMIVVERNDRTRKLIAERHRKCLVLGVGDQFAVSDRVVVLAVKPQAIDGIKLGGKAHAIISIMAGVTLNTLKLRFNADSFIRAMPNLAALHSNSATALTGDESFAIRATELFEAIGKVVWLSTEKELAVATALSGSGPGYLALIAEALANAAVRLGMQNNDAHTLTRALFGGMPSLLAAEHPALLKERISSPGGTTAAGIAALEAFGARNAIYEAVKAAYDKSVELGNSSKEYEQR